MNTKYKMIVSSFSLPSGVELRNRVLMAPMTIDASLDNGEVSDEELAYYRERSGGAGAVITGNAHILQSGKGTPNGLGADDDSLIPGLNKLATTIQEQGSKAILQINHVGRMGNPAILPHNETIGASAVASVRKDAVAPREMAEEEILSVIKAFGEATRRAIEADFDGIEIHGANTYLSQQFFSPHSNLRTDNWGGNIQKRMNFPLAVIEEVKKVVAVHAKKPFAVGYRLSPEERENPGITMEDTLEFVDVLAEQKLDYIHLSVNNFWGGSIRDVQDKRSRVVLIQERVGDRVPVIGVGALSTPDDVIKAFETGVPLVSLGHAFIMDPKWVQKVESNQESQIRVNLPKTDQKELVITDSLWNMIMNAPGWFPVV